jgi:hypothetical protein
MKQCIRCDREYPDTEKFCEMDGAYLLSEEGDELPPGVCPVLPAWDFRRESL